MTTLKQAQKDLKAMEQFIAEHKADIAESDDFDAVVGSMIGQGKPKAIQATSSKDDCDDCT